MRFARTSLGLIPDWQMNSSPEINYKINPNVHYPPGMYQTTIQPASPYYQGYEGFAGTSEMAKIKMMRAKDVGACPPGFTTTSTGCVDLRAGVLPGGKCAPGMVPTSWGCIRSNTAHPQGMGDAASTVTNYLGYLGLALGAFVGYKIYKKSKKRR